MGLFDNLTGHLFKRENPQNEANKYLSQIPGLYDPMKHYYEGITQNPGGEVNHIGENFQESPGYAFALKQALGAAQNRLNAQGMANGPEEDYTRMETAQGLANQDYYNWLNQAMGVYGQGLTGQQNILDTLGGNLQSQASNAFSGAQSKNDYRQAMLGALIGMGSSAIGARRDGGMGGGAGAFAKPMGR